MRHRPGTMAFAALCVGCSLASCAVPPRSSAPLAIEEETQSSALSHPSGQEGRKLSAVGNESDCVLMTADIHLWCKWITRYY
jgi:hypothetical protein